MGDGTHETDDLTKHENQQNRGQLHVNSSHCRNQTMHRNTCAFVLAILYQIQEARQAGPCQVSPLSQAHRCARSSTAAEVRSQISRRGPVRRVSISKNKEIGSGELCYSATTMPSMRGRSTWSRRALLAWVSLWLLMVPWVHVHPEVEHSHGDPGHVHHAIMHTVFSEPLECESHQPHYDDTDRSVIRQSIHLIGHHGHASDHPEIDYVLAAPSPCPAIDKVLLVPSGEEAPPPTLLSLSRVDSAFSITPTVLLLSSSLPLRAPPASLS